MEQENVRKFYFVVSEIGIKSLCLNCCPASNSVALGIASLHILTDMNTIELKRLIFFLKKMFWWSVSEWVG